MRATHHFHCGLLITKTQEKEKEIQRNTLEIFLEFLVFREGKQIREKKKTKMRKLFTRENSEQAKEEQGNLFGFSFILQLIKLQGKTEKKQGNIFGIFSKFFKHTKENEKINLA